MHAGERVCQTTANCCNEVGVGKRGFDNRAAHVACGTEHLSIDVSVGVDCINCCYGRHTTHTRCFAGFWAPGGSQLKGSWSLELSDNEQGESNATSASLSMISCVVATALPKGYGIRYSDMVVEEIEVWSPAKKGYLRIHASMMDADGAYYQLIISSSLWIKCYRCCTY